MCRRLMKDAPLNLAWIRKRAPTCTCGHLVRPVGLEPTRREAQEPKSCVSAKFHHGRSTIQLLNSNAKKNLLA